MAFFRVLVLFSVFFISFNAHALTVATSPVYCDYLIEECIRQASAQGCIYAESDERCFGNPQTSESNFNMFLEGHPYIDDICGPSKAWTTSYNIDETACKIMCSEAVYQYLQNSTEISRAAYPIYCEAWCGKGKYAEFIDYRLNNGSSTSSAKCKSCPVGTYYPVSNHISDYCLKCPAGTASYGGGKSSCSDCEYGQYAPEGSNTCLPCPENTYGDDYRLGECKPCPEPGIYDGEGGDGIEVCYVPENVEIKDTTGKYIYESDCWYSM